jgi:hypothetical protein
VVTGTQAEKPHDNKILVLKMSELHKTKHDESNSESESDSDGTQAILISFTSSFCFILWISIKQMNCSDSEDVPDDDPVLEVQQIPCNSCTNRIRVRFLFLFSKLS